MEKLKSRVHTDKLKKNLPLIKALVHQAGAFIMSLMLSGISFAGGISPFATGFLGGISDKYLISCALGGAVGYITFFGLFDSLRFVGAVVIICILRLFIEPKTSEKHRTALAGAVTAGGTFAVSLCVFLAVTTEGAYLIMCFCETLIAAAFSLFILRLCDIFSKRKQSIFFTTADTVSVVFTACVFLLSLENLSFHGFSPARCTAYFVILLFAMAKRESAAALAGMCCALTLGFSDTQPQLMAAFILSGLTAGLCGKHGKIPAATSLVLSSALALILKGSPDSAVISIAEAVLPASVFVFIPDKITAKITSFLLPVTAKSIEKGKEQTLQFMLRRSAKAVKDISQTVDAVSSFLKKADSPDYSEIPDMVKEDICKGCNKYDFCWNKCADISKKAFSQAGRYLIKNERLLPEDLPERLTLVCRMPDKIAGSFNRAYLELGAKILARHEICEAKHAAAKQFFCIGALLDNAAENIALLPEADLCAPSVLTPVFTNAGFRVSGICRQTGRSGISTLQVYCDETPAAYSKELLTEQIYELTGVQYLPPVVDEYTKDGTVLGFCEEGNFRVSFFTASHTGAGEDFSGDTARCFYDGKGSFFTVLSDGMGSGTRAAIDSVMTCNLMSRLIRAGFTPEISLEAVNCALLIKSAEETLSTLDIISIDLMTGLARFYKAGAGFSVIQKKEKTLILEKSSMPLGILDEVSFEKSEISLGSGDLVFIMSDGACVIPHKTFKEILKENRNSGVKELAEKIVSEALTYSVSGKHDDITVTCIKIS